MPLREDNSFKLTWRVEDFWLWTGDSESNVPWPCTPIETHGNTEWQFKLCPWYGEGFIMCSIERAFNSDVEGVNLDYKICTLGYDGSPYLHVKGTLSNMDPGDRCLVNVIRMSNVTFFTSPDDLFSIVCEISQVTPCEPVDFFQGKWKDELQILSDDMRRLFETGYLSDLKLVSVDGRRIAVHSFILVTRWRNLFESLTVSDSNTRITVRGVSGSVLYAFVSYLYTGTLSGSDVTAELFDFAVGNIPWMRKHFYSCASDIRMRTRQRKECLAFTWYVNDLGGDSLPFIRVLPLHHVDCEELVVDIDKCEDEIDDGCLNVTLSLSNVPEDCYVCIDCKITLFIEDVCVKSMSQWHAFLANVEWKFPVFIPLNLLISKTRRHSPRVEFEMVISDKPKQSVVENWFVEFRTGSRSIRNVEAMTFDMRDIFFHHRSNKLFHIILRTEDGYFLSLMALLGVRSRTLHKFFKNWKKVNVVVGVKGTDSVVLARVLEYVYTGWTTLSTLEEVRKVILIAKSLSLSGLVKKCQKFIDFHTIRAIH